MLLPKDYVRYRLSGAYVSEMSDSAGTLWMDIPARRWDDTLLAACELTEAQMPRLVEGSEVSAMLSAEMASAWGSAIARSRSLEAVGIMPHRRLASARRAAAMVSSRSALPA